MSGVSRLSRRGEQELRGSMLHDHSVYQSVSVVLKEASQSHVNETIHTLLPLIREQLMTDFYPRCPKCDERLNFQLVAVEEGELNCIIHWECSLVLSTVCCVCYWHHVTLGFYLTARLPFG